MPQPTMELGDARTVVLDDRPGTLVTTVGLVAALSKKNFQVRYKRALLGVVWVILQPAIQAAVLAVVFMRIVRIEGIDDYPLFVLSGVMPWAFFSQSLVTATTSIVDNGPLVKKVSLPLAVFPLSAIGATAMAFAASAVILVVVAVVSGSMGVQLLLLPVAIAVQLMVVAGIGLVTSAFHVAFRDVRYLVESSILVLFYATPVFYDLGAAPPGLRQLLRLNPLTGVMNLYRAAVLDHPIDAASVLIALMAAATALLVGAVVFRVRAREFPDLV